MPRKGFLQHIPTRLRHMKPSRGRQVEAITKLGFTLGKISRARDIIHKNRMNAHQGE